MLLMQYMNGSCVSNLRLVAKYDKNNDILIKIDFIQVIFFYNYYR